MEKNGSPMPGPDMRRSAPRLVGAKDIRARLGAIGKAVSRPRVEPAPVFTAPMALVALAAAVVAALSFITGMDGRVALAMRGEPDGVVAFLRILTDVGLIAWYFWPALLLTLALLLFDARARDGTDFPSPLFVMSAWFAASLGTASAITHAIKYALGRARPDLLDSHGIASFEFLRLGSAYESFPSGHSTNMGVVAMALAIWFPAIRWPILLVGACLALTRLPVEAHYLSDVVTGFAIGSLTALALARVLSLRRIVYRVDHGGRGWRGFLPRRSSAG